MSDSDTSTQLHALYRRRFGASVTEREVILLARTGGRRTYRVRELGSQRPRVFGVLGFELFDVDTKKRLDQAALDALPWRGAGPDPLGTRAPVTARMDSTTAERVES